MDDRIPPFLTVEEASRLLKIGRTKAYDLTKEWRATGGRSGLPVVDLGDVLRVPGPAIEKMLGTGLATAAPLNEQGQRERERRTRPAQSDPPPSPPKPTAEEPPAAPVEKLASAAALPTTGTRSRRRRAADQLPLFQPLSVTHPDPATPSPYDPEPSTRP